MIRRRMSYGGGGGGGGLGSELTPWVSVDLPAGSDEFQVRAGICALYVSLKLLQCIILCISRLGNPFVHPSTAILVQEQRSELGP